MFIIACRFLKISRTKVPAVKLKLKRINARMKPKTFAMWLIRTEAVCVVARETTVT